MAFILAPVTLGALCFWFQVGRPENRLVGKWVYVSGDSIGERGIEFLRRSRFFTFGYKMDGRIVDSYGTYRFVSSNRIEMKTTGFRTVFDGTNADVKLPGKFPSELIPPRYFIFSPEQQELSEADCITMPARFTRARK